MLYLATYLIVGLAFAAVMALIQGRRERFDDEPEPESTPLSVFVMIGLAWPVAAAAFVYGLLAQAFARTAPGDDAPGGRL